MRLPDERIDRVVFYRRPNIKVDPVCCEVHAAGVIYYAYEDAKLWMAVIRRLESLPGFMADWFATLSRPPYPRFRLIAFDRFGGPDIESVWEM